MAQTSVAQFAGELKVPPSQLLEQLRAAGVHKQVAEDVLSEQDKTRLLEYLRKSHGSSEPKNKITLTRKQTSEIIKKSYGSGRAHTIQVEVKKKRIFVKRDAEPGAPPEAPGPSVVAVDTREAELRDEEQRRHEELAARQAADIAEKQEREKKLAEGKPAEAKVPAAPSAGDTTLHKPKVAPGTEKKGAKKAKEIKVWKDEGVKRRTIKTRGDVQGASGWHNPKGRHRTAAAPAAESSQQFSAPVEAVAREVMVPETITVGDLAHKMSVKAAEVIKVLMKLGSMVTINQVLDQETAMIVVTDMGHLAKAAKLDDPESLLADVPEEHHEAELKPRAPVVTVMGHVDHGKTSLLDYIRRTKVAAGEAGGITQHIGAYHVETPKGMLTFLDTPGHAAFTSMRARGAQVTDIVILVVGADDGVMPQTIEAIQHAQAAKVPIVVALNKMDKPEADAEKVKQELTKYGVIPEEWGGENIFVPVSARTGQGVDQLIDSILLQAEVLELKAPTTGLAAGYVIESSLEKGRGAVATVLVLRGTLKLGDPLLIGQEFGRVRALFDEAGHAVDSAGPSIPVVVLGLSGAPNAGDELLVVESERKAREVAMHRQSKSRDVKLAQKSANMQDVFSTMGESKADFVQLLIKADVQGSVEALRDALNALSTGEVAVNIVASGVGGLTESDVTLAAASKARIIAFNVRGDAAARTAIKEHGVDVRYYSIIYEAIDDIRAVLTGMLSPEVKESIVGLAAVRSVFRSSKFGTVAGCMVIDGYVRRNFPIRVLRNSVVIFEGALESLKRFKDDVNEVRAGTECGIGVKNYSDVQENDQIECYSRVEVARTL